MESHVIYRGPEANQSPTAATEATATETANEHEADSAADEQLVEATAVVVEGLTAAGVTGEVTNALQSLLLHVLGQGPFRTDDGRAHSDTVEAVQCLHGWLDGVAAGATRQLHRAMAERFRPTVPHEELTKAEQQRWHRDVRKATQTELETTTGKGARATGQLIDLATAPPLLQGAIAEVLADGGADSYRAWRVLDATELLPDADRAEIARTVLARRPGGTRRSLQSFNKALQRAVQKQISAVPQLARKRDQRALDKRDSTSRVQDDGTGQVRTTGAVERVVAAHTRIDGIARAAKRCGDDPRTLAQLRSDVALDLLQFGTIPPTVEEDADVTDDAHTTDDVGQPPEHVTGAEARPSVRYRDLGELPPAHVDIVVSLETLLGLSNGIGDLPGLSSISAARARQAALTAGSVWRRLVADPLDGHLIEKSSHAYRPTAAVREHTRARDGVCRFPGCQRPAMRTQSDHVMPWTPDGQEPLTGTWNIESLCEFHHDAKTRALWVALMSPDGEVRWTSPTGREYTTRPQNWAHATAASTDASDAGYRWFRDQLARLIRGEDNDLELEDLDIAIEHASFDHLGSARAGGARPGGAGPDGARPDADQSTPPGARVEEGASILEEELALVLDDWWVNTKAALENLELWHRTEGGANRRGMAPGEAVPPISTVPLAHEMEVQLSRGDTQAAPTARPGPGGSD
ncbi:HNH endonuclease signature motif containing protein [Ornithinicoccus hortensis]|uniref:HNH endonuclease n=1 Tax=Ornithinicoccus hortensis TaxID=82346 RepID=A0A542YQX2_9MICO|nr:HNH endonuclease signature motif containing protein [Ornithinicoccus hortensis]TQL50502.1 hypothetical protein FB467_1613 [Ornithinicoccus hortensis]